MRPLLLLAGPRLTAAACRTAPEIEWGGAEVPEVAVVVDADGPWREVPVADTGSPSGPPRPPYRSSPPPPVRAAPFAARPLALPPRRVTPPPREAMTPPRKAPEDLARERHLDHPTRVRADRITFYCPAPFLPEVRLTGDDLSSPAPGRRVADGSARLVCRELTLEAGRITVVTRSDARADVQVAARGGVDFASDQRGRVFHEEGLRALLITNDRVAPLP